MSDSLIPIANEAEYQCDENKSLFLMWAGAYGDTKAYVWADSFDAAFEEFTEYLDEHAPGCLTTVTEDDLKNAAKELELRWPGFPGPQTCDEDQELFDKIVEHAEADLTLIGHTTLKNGTHIVSYEWGGDEITDSDERQEVSARSDGKTRYAYGNGEPGCLFDNASGPYETQEDAVKAAVEALELEPHEEQELLQHGIYYPRGDRRHEIGASMIQIFEVEASWTWD